MHLVLRLRGGPPKSKKLEDDIRVLQQDKMDLNIELNHLKTELSNAHRDRKSAQASSNAEKIRADYWEQKWNKVKSACRAGAARATSIDREHRLLEENLGQQQPQQQQPQQPQQVEVVVRVRIERPSTSRSRSRSSKSSR